MNIIVSQQNKKILIAFESGKSVDKYRVDKADDFLTALDHVRNRARAGAPEGPMGRAVSNVVDRFIRKRKISSIRQIGPIGRIEFQNTGILTERIIRAIIVGLRF